MLAVTAFSFDFALKAGQLTNGEARSLIRFDRKGGCHCSSSMSQSQQASMTLRSTEALS